MQEWVEVRGITPPNRETHAVRLAQSIGKPLSYTQHRYRVFDIVIGKLHITVKQAAGVPFYVGR